MRSTAVSKKQTIDFTEGKPAGLILQFFWPLMMTSMCQQLYNFVDSVIVGRGISDNALAAVGNMSSLFFLIVGFSFGLAPTAIMASFLSLRLEALSRNQFALTTFPAMHQPP